MPANCVQVARGLLLHGERVKAGGDWTRAQFLARVGVNDNTFRSAATDIGAKEAHKGLRFFEAAERSLSLGPGAGLVLGMSVGYGSMRAALVDANGALHEQVELPASPGQLEEGPESFMPRLLMAAEEVLTPALARPELCVNGQLPLLGVAVAWPTAIDRQNNPVGLMQLQPRWRGSLRQRVSRLTHLDVERCHSLNDVDAAALAVAFDRTRHPDHLKQSHPELTFVLRLAGGIGGATIILEPPQRSDPLGNTSGFLLSTLLGGVDTLAGEIGHVTVPGSLIDDLNTELPEGLEPLEPRGCSCTPASVAAPGHLEAFASAAAVAARIDTQGDMAVVVERVTAQPKDERHEQALRDVGVLVAEALKGPIAWLNPARIVLTGVLAVDPVERELDKRLIDFHPFTTHPAVRALPANDNDFIRVRGAGLAVLREHVYRRLPDLLGGPKKTLPTSVRALMVPLDGLPWS